MRRLSDVSRGGVFKRAHGNLSVDISSRTNIFSRSWATSFMKKHQFAIRSRTGDNTVQPDYIVQRGTQFYSNLKPYENCNERLVFNVDEFFVVLNGNGANSKWTWERIVPGRRQNVAIESAQLGYTCSVMTNMAGEIVLYQMIWVGETDRARASPSPEVFPAFRAHPAIFQTHRKDSHFQSSATWADFLSRFKERVQAIRLEIGDLSSKALLIVDAACRHSDTRKELEGKNIDVVEIPPKCAHVFQPGDACIANIKKNIDQGWGRYVEEVFTPHPVDQAVTSLDENAVRGRQKLPYQRELNFCLVTQSLHMTACSTIVASWEVTGIVRALRPGARIPEKAVVFDTYVEIERLRAEGADDFAPPMEDDVAPVQETPRVVVPLTQNVVLEGTPLPHPPPAVDATVVRPVGRPKKLPAPPVAASHSIMHLLSRMKRQRDENPPNELN